MTCQRLRAEVGIAGECALVTGSIGGIGSERERRGRGGGARNGGGIHRGCSQGPPHLVVGNGNILL